MALVTYSGKNVFGICLATGDIIKLLPGVNEVEDKLLEIIKKQPLFQSRIAKGLIQILMEKLGNDGKRSLEDMLTHIPNIFDTKLLKKIIQNDGRERVIKAANEQLDKIKNPEKTKQDNSDEHFS
jgi:hypothetical protein